MNRINKDIENTLATRLLQKVDVPEAYRLSTQAKWNQTESDWLRLLDHNPENCFIFRKNNQSVGTATIAAFGRELAWIGMIIVDQALRGQEIGQYILKTVIHVARQQGYKIIGLDATGQGRRLYQHHGFHDVSPIDRWSGVMKISQPVKTVCPIDEKLLQEVIRLDRHWSGCDRSRLLQLLYLEKSVQSLGLIRDNVLRGFTFIRPGRNFRHLGPLLAESKEDFSVLLDAASVILQGQPVLADALRRQETSTILKQQGLEIQRRLIRMTLDEAQPALMDPRLRLSVSFEWG